MDFKELKSKKASESANKRWQKNQSDKGINTNALQSQSEVNAMKWKTSITGNLNYSEMNHFLLGVLKCKENNL